MKRKARLGELTSQSREELASQAIVPLAGNRVVTKFWKFALHKSHYIVVMGRARQHSPNVNSTNDARAAINSDNLPS